MIHKIITTVVILSINFIFIETCTNITEFKSIDNYIDALSQCQSQMNISWYTTKTLIQDSAEINKLPVDDLFLNARANIKNKTQAFSKEIAENCILDKERDFLVLFHEMTETMLTCVTHKSLKIIHAIIDIQDAIDNKRIELIALREKCKVSNKTADEQSTCLQHAEAAKAQEAAQKLFSRAKHILEVARTVPARLKECSDALVTLVRQKVEKIVNTVDECGKSNKEGEE